jgi:hypothetical protein
MRLSTVLVTLGVLCVLSIFRPGPTAQINDAIDAVVLLVFAVFLWKRK